MAARQYRVHIAPAAERDLRALPVEVLRRIRPRIDGLATDPRPPGVEKLAGGGDLYRLRVGDYRIIYQVQDRAVLVLIVRVRHRRDVYR